MIVRRTSMLRPPHRQALLLCLVALISGGCRGREQRVKVPAATHVSAAPATDAGVVVGAASATADAGVGIGSPAPAKVMVGLYPIAARELSSLPDRFDPAGHFIALSSTEGDCHVWSLRDSVYVGTVPSERCADWLPASSISLPRDAKFHEESSDEDLPGRKAPSQQETKLAPDGQLTVHWQGGKVWLTRPQQPELPVTAGCRKARCRKVQSVTISPDSRFLALLRQPEDRVFLVDTTTGKETRTLKLKRHERLLNGLLSWGPYGLLAVVVDLTGHDDEDGSGRDGSEPTTVELALWPTPTSAREAAGSADGEGGYERAIRHEPASAGWKESFDSETRQGTIVLDPLGRFLVIEREVRRSGSSISFEGPGKEGSGLGSSTPDDNNPCGDSDLSSGAWRSGLWPVWETIEGAGENCPGDYTAWQIYTAPGQRGLGKAALKVKPSESAVRVVKEDGKTVITLHGKAAKAAAAQATAAETDSGMRWAGTGKNSLRRLLDKEELIFDENGCAHTASEVYDCKLSFFAEKDFLLGKDPLTAPRIGGVQVAHLFYHRNLIEDFFEGRSVAPDPRSRGPVGQPPRLEKTAHRYLDGQTPNLEVTLLAHDGGDGVSGLRVWLDGRPFALTQPIPLQAGKPTVVPLTLPTSSCARVGLQACNGPGLVCSELEMVPFCPAQQHKLK